MENRWIDIDFTSFRLSQLLNESQNTRRNLTHMPSFCVETVETKSYIGDAKLARVLSFLGYVNSTLKK